MTIYFYSTIDEYGAFSNFSRHGFELDGLYWPTSEHYFQAQKFESAELRERIRTARRPKDAAQMGRDRRNPLRKDWEQVKDQVMRAALEKKFRTHPELRELLLSTGEQDIIENAPGDYYWGCGKDGRGLNRLGALLKELRAEFKSLKSSPSED